MKPATLVALVCVLRCEWSGSFLVSPARGPCSFKRKRAGRPQQQHQQLLQQQQQHVSSRRNGSSLMQASREVEWEVGGRDDVCTAVAERVVHLAMHLQSIRMVISNTKKLVAFFCRRYLRRAFFRAAHCTASPTFLGVNYST